MRDYKLSPLKGYIATVWYSALGHELLMVQNIYGRYLVHDLGVLETVYDSHDVLTSGICTHKSAFESNYEFIIYYIQYI